MPKLRQWKTGLIGGAEKRDIRISPADPGWPARFDALARPIITALGRRCLALHHIGSTAVPGLAAKPIIDMLLVVVDAGDEPAYLPPLLRLGLQLRVREPDWHDHRMLRNRTRDLHLHVFSTGCPQIATHLHFRDRLRADPVARDSYQALKMRLARLDWPDMNAYASAKSDLIREILSDDA